MKEIILNYIFYFVVKPKKIQHEDGIIAAYRMMLQWNPQVR